MGTRRVAIRVRRVIDGNGRVSKGEAVITISAGLIESIRPAVQCTEAEGGSSTPEVIDHSSLVALPGFIDAHVHVSGVSMADLYPELQDTEMLTTFGKRLTTDISAGVYVLAGVRNAQQLLSAGVTTARDCGARDDVAFWLRDGIKLGFINGPRLLISGSPITMTGGHGHYWGGEADGPDETRKLARKLLKKGVDFIKVMATGGLGTPTTNIGRASYSAEEMRAIVEEAHKSGRMVAAHILARQGIEPCLDAGIDHFEHVWFMEPDGSTRFDERLVVRMVEQDVVCTPTPATAYRRAERIRRKMAAGTATEQEVKTAEWCERRIEQNVQNLLRMRSMGLKMMNGTDALARHVIPFDDYATSLEVMVKGGMSPLDAISMATSEPARILGINAGVLEPGRFADICLVEGDPDRSISALRNMRKVFKEGVMVYDSDKRLDP